MDQEATTTSMEQQFAAVTAPGVSDRLRQAESGALQVMQLKRKLIHLAKRLDDNRLAIRYNLLAFFDQAPFFTIYRAIGDLQLLRGRSFKLYTNDAGAMYEKAASDDVCRRLLAGVSLIFSRFFCDS